MHFLFLWHYRYQRKPVLTAGHHWGRHKKFGQSLICLILGFYILPQLRFHIEAPGLRRFIKLLLWASFISPERCLPMDDVEWLQKIKSETKLFLGPLASLHYSASPSHLCTKTLLYLPSYLSFLFSYSMFLVGSSSSLECFQNPQFLWKLSLISSDTLQSELFASLCLRGPPFAGWLVEYSPHLSSLSFNCKI